MSLLLAKTDIRTATTNVRYGEQNGLKSDMTKMFEKAVREQATQQDPSNARH
jgi:hypothetical protein